MREVLADTLAELCTVPECPFVVTADLVVPLRLEEFRLARPDRFIDVGIAEQCMVSVAAGIASVRSPVLAATFATFALRSYEAYRNLVVLDRRHVILVGAHAGLATGPNGATHQAVEDLEIFGALPAVRIFAPADAIQAKAMLLAALRWPSPYYVRLSRWAPPRIVDGNGLLLEQHWSRLYFPRGMYVDPVDVCIYSYGVTWPIACDAADIVSAQLPMFSIAAVHIGELTHTQLPTITQRMLTVLIADAVPDSRIGNYLGRIGGCDYLSIGASWPLGSDEPDRLYAEAGLTGVAAAKDIMARLASKEHLS